MSTLVLINYIR